MRHRIQNSLEGIPKETLLSRVEQFVYDKGLVNYLGVFQKGALLAQSPDSFETIEELMRRIEGSFGWR